MVTFSPYPQDPRPRRAADALLNQEMVVDLICLREGNAPSREVLNSINVLRLPLTKHRGGKISYVYQYCAFILMASAVLAVRSFRSRYDLVYIHNMPDVLVLSALVPKMLGAKVVLDLHDPMPELLMTIFQLAQDSPEVRLIRWLEKWSIARANLVLTVNLACKRLFCSRGCDPEKIKVVMNSPDGDIFPVRAPQVGSATRPRANQPFVIMYHGSLVERNGLDLAVDAVGRVRAMIPSAELKIYGPSTPFLENVMASARSQRLDGAVQYLGPRQLESLVAEIEACDLGIIPNHRNVFTEINTPTRIFEYLALGKPVIAPQTPGIQDYFGAESLFFFEAGNAADLAEKIEYAYSHPSRAVEIAQQGQQVYLAHMWSQERQTLVNVTRELLA